MEKLTHKYAVIILMCTLLVWLSCSNYEILNYQDLRTRMYTTYVGSQTGDGTGSFHDQEVILLPVGDSSIMIIGLFYDSLIAKIKSIDYSDGFVTGSGDSVSHFFYRDENESLRIIKDLQDTPFFTFTGKRKK